MSSNSQHESEVNRDGLENGNQIDERNSSHLQPPPSKSQVTSKSNTVQSKQPPQSSTPPPPYWLYDLMVWIFTVIFDLFFRQILPRGAYRIPKKGPIIFVAAPHANQFVDPMMLMQQVKFSSGRRVSFLVAEASTKRPFIGFMSWATNAIGVTRAQDNLVKGDGVIYMKENDPLTVYGEGTKFTESCQEGGHIGLPFSLGMNDIDKIISDEELTLRKEFKPKARELLLKGNVSYKTANRVNHSDMYHRVFSHLHNGNCLGIFPEGGSHDRPDLLPIKAGVSIMALGALAENRDSNVKIVPCGMNYFHAHKFRSRAVIEFGEPIDVPAELVDQYIAGGEQKRKAVKSLLDTITVALKSVTVTCSDYDLLMTIQAARRLYLPKGKQYPLSVVVELTRRFTEGYNKYKDDPRIIHMRESVSSYNRQLNDLGIKDHQVETATLSPFVVIGKIIFRTMKLLILLIFSLPGAILFSPIFVATKRISILKADQALKASSVKIAARDVIATWKVLVALGLAPILYTFYAFLATYMAYKYEISTSYKSLLLVTITSYVVLPSITYAALIIGETGMDIFKSLRPLALALNPSHKNTLAQLKSTRVHLMEEITELVNTLGPELYPGIEQDRLRKDISDEFEFQRSKRRDRTDSSASTFSLSSNDDSVAPSAAISRVNSGLDLSDIPLFSYFSSSGSHTPSHSRGTSESSIDENDTITDKVTGRETFSEINRRIRGAMAERQNRDN